MFEYFFTLDPLINHLHIMSRFSQRKKVMDLRWIPRRFYSHCIVKEDFDSRSNLQKYHSERMNEEQNKRLFHQLWRISSLSIWQCLVTNTIDKRCNTTRLLLFSYKHWQKFLLFLQRIILSQINHILQNNMKKQTTFQSTPRSRLRHQQSFKLDTIYTKPYRILFNL